jgi:cytochrome c biogenesis protein CcdA
LLASALTLVASEGGVARGGLVLGFFGLGAATPLVAVAYASRKGFQSAQGWILVRIDQVKKGFAALIILTGLAILTGVDKWLEAQVVQRMPDVWLHLTTLF